MSTKFGPVQGRTGRVRAALGAAIALVLGCVGMVASQTAASARSIDAITGVEIVADGSPTVGSSVRVDATWSAPGARAGDTFTLQLPTSPRFDGIAGSFPLTDTKDPGATIGTCTVTTTELTCTFGEYADTHTGLQGSVYFWANAKEKTTRGSVEFVTGAGVVIEAKIPGGGIQPEAPYVFPAKPWKDARIDHANGEIDWAIYVPGAALLGADGGPVTVTDTFDPQLTLRAAPRILVFTKAEWEGPRPWGNGRYLTDSDFTFTPAAEPNSFQIWVAPQAIDAGNIYIIEYQTPLPAGVANGDSFANEATAGTWSAAREAMYFGAGGTGTGASLRELQIVKVVAGENPAAGPFGFQVACVDASGSPVAGYPKSVEVSVDEPASVPGVQIGWTCTVNETDAAGGRVSYDGPNSVTVTEDSPATIVVTATNTFTSELTGGLVVSKTVAGPAASAVPADTQYSVEYSYGEGSDAVTGLLALTTESTGVLEGLPLGTVVTLKEVEPAEIDGVTWAAPSFVVDGEAEGDTADVTIGEETVVEVELTNTAGSPPCDSAEKDEGECAPVGGPGSGGADAGNGLAQTGATAAIVAGAALLLIGTGAVLLALRRRARA